MKTYTKQDFHNPEQLTRQQVGEEYRLLLPEEVDGRFGSRGGAIANVFYADDATWSTGFNCGANWMEITYRVPLATPLPDGTVLSSNECCWSDDVYADVKAAHAAGKKIEWRPTSESIWRDDEAEVPAWEGYGFEFRIKQEPCKKRAYVAGPMSNMPDYNFPAFFKASEELEKQGYEAINPAQMDLDSGWTLEEIKDLDVAQFQEFLKGAAKRDLDALQQCDAIALLPGWENSKGARAELAVAEWLGLDVMYLDGAERSRDGAGVFGASSDDKYPDEDGWIPHVPGDPMPCQANDTIDLKFVGWDNKFDVEAGIWSGPDCNHWTGNDCDPCAIIKAWRPAQARELHKWLNTPLTPYNSDERAEWDVSSLMSKLQSSIALDDPKGAAGAKKPPMHLLPPNALIETAKAMGHGAAKYGAWNFIETTVCASTYVGALGRHWAAYARSEDIDPDSGLPHLALIAANCFVLLTAQQQGTLRDDRPKLK